MKTDQDSPSGRVLPSYTLLPHRPSASSQEAPWETEQSWATHKGLVWPSLSFLWRCGFCIGPAQWLLKNAPGLPALVTSASGPLGCIHAFLLSSSLPSMSKCSLRTQQQKTYFQRPVFCLKKENLNLLLRKILYLLCAVGTTPEMLLECAVGTIPELLLECLCLGHLSH